VARRRRLPADLRGRDDPDRQYVSHAPLRSLLLRRPALPNSELIERYIPGPVAAVLVGHTHWDHAVDAPAIARRDRCKVYGSDSLQRLMRLHGLDGVVVEPRHRYEIGPFTVTFIPSRHSKLLTTRAAPTSTTGRSATCPSTSSSRA
jgi:L-ascorbate metabolism protein UlaG (beta-lactamase superfamily)